MADSSEAADAQLVDEALRLLEAGDRSGARRILVDVAGRAPSEYVRSLSTEQGTIEKFWSLEEFLASATAPPVGDASAPLVTWVPSVYPRASYLLAAMDLEAADLEAAWAHIAASLRLEPDHALALCEAGLIASRQGHHERAVELFDRALRSPVAAIYRQRALRGKAVELIELQDLGSALACLEEALSIDPHDERALEEALSIDPHDERALEEVAYVQHLRRGGSRVETEVIKQQPGRRGDRPPST